MYIYIHIYTYSLLSGIVQIESGHNRRPRGSDLSKVVVKVFFPHKRLNVSETSQIEVRLKRRLFVVENNGETY